MHLCTPTPSWYTHDKIKYNKNLVYAAFNRVINAIQPSAPTLCCHQIQLLIIVVGESNYPFFMAWWLNLIAHVIISIPSFCKRKTKFSLLSRKLNWEHLFPIRRRKWVSSSNTWHTYLTLHSRCSIGAIGCVWRSISISKVGELVLNLVNALPYFGRNSSSFPVWIPFKMGYIFVI